jgi:hypothetical protein
VALFVALVSVATVAMFLVVVRDLPGPDAPLDLPWPVWVAAFAISEFLVVHVQLQRDSHSLSLTDLAFVAGLYLLEPATLVAAQVAGVGLTLLLQRRQFGLKFAFNLAQYGLAGSLATSVFTVLSEGGVLSGAWSWVAALAGVTASTLTVSACVFAVMWLSEGRQSVAGLPRMLGLSICSRQPLRWRTRRRSASWHSPRSCSSPPTAPTPGHGSSRTTSGCCTR